jgi:TPR repeat protein
MSDNIKMQDTVYTNEWDNLVEISKTEVIIENHQTSNKEFNEASLSAKNSESQEILSQLIQSFNKINIKEIDPIVMSNEQEKLLFEEGFDIIVDDINNLIYGLRYKGHTLKLDKQQIIKYFNNYNINSQKFYNWLLNNQISLNSIFLLGYFNYHGIVMSMNKEKAFNLFINASENNHILAQYFVAQCYFYGDGTTKDEKLAFEYYEKVANKNLPSGQVGIGYCYEMIKKDSKKALYWYEKAANNGNMMAMHNLGLCYINGNGVEKDYNKAFELYKKSAEGGYSSGITMLGYCYSNGIGTKINKQKAFELYQNAANLGHDVAQNNLALMYYEDGDGIIKDVDKAIYWFEKSAKQGYVLAINNLKILQKEINNL